MTIDIIDLSDPQYADLSPVQLAMVRAAQAKKDAVTAQAATSRENLFYHLLGNDNLRASVRTREEGAIDQAAETEIAVIREDLLYQLAYEALGSEGNELGPYRRPVSRLTTWIRSPAPISGTSIPPSTTSSLPM